MTRVEPEQGKQEATMTSVHYLIIFIQEKKKKRQGKTCTLDLNAPRLNDETVHAYLLFSVNRTKAERTRQSPRRRRE